MAYSDFTLARVQAELGITLDTSQNLFAQVEPVQPSALLAELLQDYIPLAINIGTEKARSELMIAPVLAEVRRQLNNQISLFSGSEFNVDKDKGLQGYCDYILSRSPLQIEVDAPVAVIVEAKNENIKGGLGQCIAGMVAAQIFNQRAGLPLRPIYGAVATGDIWRFLKLDGTTAYIDQLEYFIGNLGQLLGILQVPFV